MSLFKIFLLCLELLNLLNVLFLEVIYSIWVWLHKLLNTFCLFLLSLCFQLLNLNGIYLVLKLVLKCFDLWTAIIFQILLNLNMALILILQRVNLLLVALCKRINLIFVLSLEGLYFLAMLILLAFDRYHVLLFEIFYCFREVLLKRLNFLLMLEFELT
jgi:hypothetical protein